MKIDKGTIIKWCLSSWTNLGSENSWDIIRYSRYVFIVTTSLKTSVKSDSLRQRMTLTRYFMLLMGCSSLKFSEFNVTRTLKLRLVLAQSGFMVRTITVSIVKIFCSIKIAALALEFLGFTISAHLNFRFSFECKTVKWEFYYDDRRSRQ